MPIIKEIVGCMLSGATIVGLFFQDLFSCKITYKLMGCDGCEIYSPEVRYNKVSNITIDILKEEETGLVGPKEESDDDYDFVYDIP